MKKLLVSLALLLVLGMSACVEPEMEDPVTRINNALEAIELPEETDEDIHVPTTSEGETVLWESDNPTVLAEDGTVNQPDPAEGDVTVTLTATVRIEEDQIYEESKDFEVTVEAGD